MTCFICPSHKNVYRAYICMSYTDGKSLSAILLTLELLMIFQPRVPDVSLATPIVQLGEDLPPAPPPDAASPAQPANSIGQCQRLYQYQSRI